MWDAKPEMSEFYSWRTIKVGEIYKLLREVDSFTCDDVNGLGISTFGADASWRTKGGQPGPIKARKLPKHSNVLVIRKHYVDSDLTRLTDQAISQNPVCQPISRWIEVLESDQALWIPVPTEWLSRREMILLAEYEANLDNLADALGASYHKP